MFAIKKQSVTLPYHTGQHNGELHVMANRFGIIFDIDGVLLKSHKAIPEAKQALKILTKSATRQNAPFIFVTNDGGTPEHIKADILSKELEIEAQGDFIFASHTPFKELGETYQHDRVLFVGKKREYTTAIANSCGFQNYVLLEDFAAQHPLLCPWNKYEPVTAPPKDEQRIKAIFMTHEPVDWAEGLQVLCDILLAAGHLDSLQHRDNWRQHSQIPIYVANPDFTYSAQYKAPRFTSGAFLICLQNLYKELTQRDLTVTVYGKPFPETYIYAQKLLHRMTGSDEPLHTVYAIGDNPLSDIKGGNAVGWFTILVRTGCFQGGDNDPVNPAQHVCNTVLDAILFILEREGVKPVLD